MKTPHRGVVANVDDHMNVFLGNDLNKAPEEFRSAGAPGEYGVVGGHPDILRGAQASGPEIQENRRNDVFEVLDFAFDGFPLEESENGANDRFDA